MTHRTSVQVRHNFETAHRLPELGGCHRSIADAVLTRGYHTTIRLHMLLWPQEDRGR